MSWRNTWRREAWSWARRLDRIALEWHKIERMGRVNSQAIRLKRTVVRRVRGWLYEVVERFLGGVDRLPNKVAPLPPLGALPHLVIGGAVVVTVATIGGWIATEEERVIAARAKVIDAEARRVEQLTRLAAETNDPEALQRLADAASPRGVVTPEGEGLSWAVGLAAVGAVAGAVVLLRRKRPGAVSAYALRGRAPELAAA